MQRHVTRNIRRAPMPVPVHPMSPTAQQEPIDSTGCMDSDQARQPKPIPDWVLIRPFQYNGRVLATALPGLFLVLSLAGELLLTVIVIGAIVLHLIDSVGPTAKRQTLIAFLFIFVAVQLSIIYSAIPVVWISIFNVIILVILNMFVVLTGGWILLQFPALLLEEPVLAEMIELSLFTIYPAVSVTLTSWMIGTVLSTNYLHYVVIIHGFLLLRLFITPNQPSFRKSNYREKQTGIAYVIGAPEIALLLLAYSIVPTVIFVLCNFWNLTKYSIIIELVFVISTPLFLASFLELRSWAEHAGIPYKIISVIRWIGGFITLTVTCAMLMQTKSSTLVPWLLPVTILNVFLGSVSNSKNYAMKAFTLLLAVVVGVMYTLAIMDAIPWHLDLPNIDLSWISILLITCAVLSIACFIVANTRNKQLLSTLLICNMASVVYVEYTLSQHQLCSPPLLVATTSCAVYLLTRLYNAEVIAWHAAWIGTALHSIKILPLLHGLNSDSIEPTLIRSACILFAVLVITKLIFFEKRTEMPVLIVYQYVLAICASVMLLYLSVLQKLWLTLLPSPPTVQDATSMFIIICSAICLKLTFYHVSHLRHVRKANILVMIAGLMALILQPRIPTSVLEIVDWFIIISSCIALMTAIGMLPPSQNGGILFLQSLMVGIAAGVHTCQYLLGPQVSFTHSALYSGICTLCAFIVYSIWHWNLAKGSRGGATKMPNVTLQFVVLCIVTVLTFIVEVSTLPMGKITLSSLALPCTQLNCVVYLVIAVLFKVHRVWQQSTDPFNYTAGNIPTLMNISAILCYLLAILNCPIEPWEIWNCTCAVVLLLLEKDPIVLPSLPAQKQSGLLVALCMVNLYIASAIHCELWHSGLGFFGLLELLILIAILPVHLALGREFCSNVYSPSPELVVFVSPLYSILYITGSSYTSWLLATLGLSSGTWFIVHKLSDGNEITRR